MNIKDNPLLDITNYQDNKLPFDIVETKHFLPALEFAIDSEKKEIEEIKNVTDVTFANVIEALEISGEWLERITSIFFHFDGVNNTDELQEITLEFKTKLTAHSSDISLDEKLFTQIKSVYDRKGEFNLSDEQELLLSDAYKSFVRNGALLNEADKNRLREIDEKLAEIQNNFEKNILSETNDFELYIAESEKSRLSGLPENSIATAFEDAKEKGEEGKYLFTLHAPSVIAVLTYAEDRKLREDIWRAFSTRCKSGDNDNTSLVLEIVKLRSQRASLLGYKTHADYVLEERMAKNKETVFEMLNNYKNIVVDAAKEEHKKLADFIISSSTDFSQISDVKPWDLGFYAEKLKQEKFGFNSEELRPYFKFENVREGAFKVASKLYDISFKQSSEYPLYHDEVEVFEVIDNKDDSLIGVLYTDYFPRKTKRGGAWMNDYSAQKTTSSDARIAPIIGNHGNFTKPTKDQPSLLTLNEVLTLFHEFGHGLHGLLSDTKYSSQAGTNVKWDFVELPSQFMENYVLEEEVLNMFAVHYETGENMPSELIERMKSARNFRSASAFARQIQFGILDMVWHTSDVENIKDVESFESETCNDFYILPREGSITSSAFSHIFAGGYSAGYYSYKWAEVLDADAFEAFKENGLFDQETAKKFRKLLSSGGSQDPEDLYITFRGNKPNPDALLRREGLLAE